MLQILENMDSAAIAEYVASLDSLENTAILSRTHYLLQKLSCELSGRGVDHSYIGRRSTLIKTEEFSRFHAFLKLICNDKDNFAFLLIKDLIGLSAEEYSTVRVKAATDGLSHFEAWRSYPGIDDIQWQSFFDAMGNEDFYEIISTDAIPSNGHKEEIYGFAWDWLTKNPNGTIKQYLDWLATYDLQDDLSEEQEGLVLSTIHGVKGLEFETVIIAGANEGIIPSKQAIAAGEIEEERRLMYVAMTRARDHLVVAVRPERTVKDDRVFESPQSRFVGEMS